MKGVLSSDVIGRLQDRRASGQEILDSWSLITSNLGLCRLLFVLDTIQIQGCKKTNCTTGCTCRLAGLRRRGSTWRYRHAQSQCVCVYVCVERAVLGFWPVHGCLTITD